MWCIYTYIYIGAYVRITESRRKILWTRLKKKEMVVLEISLAMDTLDFEMVVNDEENGCRFEEPGKKVTRDLHGWTGKGCRSFILTQLLNSSTCSGIGGDPVTSYLSGWCRNYYQSC